MSSTYRLWCSQSAVVVPSLLDLLKYEVVAYEGEFILLL